MYFPSSSSFMKVKIVLSNFAFLSKKSALILEKIASFRLYLKTVSSLVKQNGDVYTSDESRMISEMGSDDLHEHWKMGNVNDRNCLATMREKRTEILENGRLENYSECKDCVYSPFCYADPIKKWYIQNIAGENYESYCGIRKELFRFVFDEVKNADEKKLVLFRRWANA